MSVAGEIRAPPTASVNKVDPAISHMSTKEVPPVLPLVPMDQRQGEGGSHRGIVESFSGKPADRQVCRDYRTVKGGNVFVRTQVRDPGRKGGKRFDRHVQGKTGCDSSQNPSAHPVGDAGQIKPGGVA